MANEPDDFQPIQCFGRTWGPCNPQPEWKNLGKNHSACAYGKLDGLHIIVFYFGKLCQANLYHGDDLLVMGFTVEDMDEDQALERLSQRVEEIFKTLQPLFQT